MGKERISIKLRKRFPSKEILINRLYRISFLRLFILMLNANYELDPAERLHTNKKDQQVSEFSEQFQLIPRDSDRS